MKKMINHQEATFVYVEDHLPSQTVMKLILRELGYVGLTVFSDSHNFIGAIEQLAPEPNVFFLDIHVRPHTGFEMLKMLREHPRFCNAFVIALTASVMSDEIEMLREAGFDGVIGKPISEESFEETLTRLLNGEQLWMID